MCTCAGDMNAAQHGAIAPAPLAAPAVVIHAIPPPAPPMIAFVAPPPPVVNNIVEFRTALAPTAAAMGDVHVGVDGLATATTLYSNSFATCVPVIAFRANAAHTTLKHAFTVLKVSDIEDVLAAAPNPQRLIVIARDPTTCREQLFGRKIAFGRRSFEAVARRHPLVQFEYHQIQSDERLHVRVDGNAGTFTVDEM